MMIVRDRVRPGGRRRSSRVDPAATRAARARLTAAGRVDVGGRRVPAAACEARLANRAAPKTDGRSVCAKEAVAMRSFATVLV